MEENFKVPSLDNRIKFVARKPSEKSSNDSGEQPSNSELPTDGNKVSKTTQTNPLPVKKSKCPYVEPKWSEKPG